jgi:CBS domain-containing protein
MKQMPQIQKVMTPMPHTIGRDISIKTAFEMMREHRIRHLPVQEGGKLVGIFTAVDGMRVLGETLQSFYKIAPMQSFARGRV